MKKYDPDQVKNIISEVGDWSGDVIRQNHGSARCPDKIGDSVRRRVRTENLYIYAVLKGYVFVLVGIREIGEKFVFEGRKTK